MTAKTDRELLELAAKAAGIELDWHITPRTGVDGPQPALADCGATWNPLTDDGDALRLAVKLQIYATYFPRLGYATAATSELCVDEYAPEAEAMQATRRAIVRAAAAIGETL